MDLLGDLALLLELAEHKSFSTVARRRSQATSSIARRLDRLEDLVGERLFNRTPKGLFLTQAGKHRLAKARALTSQAAAFLERSKPDEPLNGRVVLSAPTRLGEVCVSPIVAKFLAMNPKATVDLHFTDEIQDIDKDGIDLALRIGGSTPGHHIIHRIAKNYRILVVSPQYLAEYPPIDSPKDLLAMDAIVLGNYQDWQITDGKGKIFSFQPKARLTCLSGDVVLKMCEAGLGIALKSVWDCADALSTGRLVRILPGFVQFGPADIMIVKPDRRLLSPTLLSLSSVLERELKKTLNLAMTKIG